MKKMLRKVAAAAAAVAMIMAFASCGPKNYDDDDEDDDDEKVSKIYDGATIIEEAAGKESCWADFAYKVPGSIASRLQPGSKVIFTLGFGPVGLDGSNTQQNGDYVKFVVNDGAWGGSIVVDTYYKENGSKLDVTKHANGFYESADGACDDGKTYYFVVTEENLDMLKGGFAIGGYCTIKKLGITNLLPPPDTTGAATVTGSKLTFTANKASYANTDVVILFKFNRTAAGKAEKFTLADVDMEVTFNGEPVTAPTEITCELDPYAWYDGSELSGTYGPVKDMANSKEYKYKLALTLSEAIKADDVVTVELKSAKIVNAEADVTEDIVKSLTVAFVDIHEKSGYWNPLVATNDENFLPAIDTITGTIETAEPADPVDPSDPADEPARPAVGDVVYTASGDALTIAVDQNIYGDPAVSHGVQKAYAGSDILAAGAKAGETYKIVMKGTATGAFSANVQFLTDAWGGLGEAVVANFTEEAFVISGYYTFNADTAAGFRFVIGNTDAECTDKTLTLTEFTITREDAPAPEGE